MMAKKDDDDDDKEDESLEMPAETPVEAEIPMEAMHKDKKDMKKEAMHDKKDKKKMDEYKIQKSANNSDMSDKSAKGATPSVGGAKVKTGAAPIKSSGDEKGRPAPTAQKMGEFENSPGKDKASAMKPQKANTADGSEKSAKSPISGK